jgi:hypothetical protein
MDTPFPWSPRRQSAHHPSPLGPTQPAPISILQRRPVLGLSMNKHLPTPITPSPSSPRTPLAFLSNSSLSTSTSLSSLSSIGSELQLQLQTPRSSFSSPSSTDMRLPDFASISQTPTYMNDGTISVPKPHKSSISSSLSSIHEHGLPTLMDRLTYLQSGPPSPPIVIPSVRLLELPPNRNPDTANQQSIASPFVNLNTDSYICSPTSTFPFPLSARRTSRERRPSSLVNELTDLHLDDRSPTRPRPRPLANETSDDPPVPAPRQ